MGKGGRGDELLGLIELHVIQDFPSFRLSPEAFTTKYRGNITWQHLLLFNSTEHASKMILN